MSLMHQIYLYVQLVGIICSLFWGWVSKVRVWDLNYVYRDSQEMLTVNSCRIKPGASTIIPKKTFGNITLVNLFFLNDS